MKIAIIGAGQVGQALAAAFGRAGHAIVFGVKDPQSPDADRLKAEFGADAASVREACLAGDVICLALPWEVAEAALGGLPDLAGKTVIDCMNPLATVDGALALSLGFDTSAGERVARWLPGGHVVKTLNQVGAEIMANAAACPARPVMFMASDHASAKDEAAALLTQIGFEPLDAGPLKSARLLEPLAMVWINQALAQGLGRAWALSVTRSEAAS